MSETTGEGQRILRTAADKEIAEIIDQVAQTALENNNGYFYENEITAAIDAAGIKINAKQLKGVLKGKYHRDELGPKQKPDSKTGPKPYNANDPIKPEPSSNPLVGMPDLGGISKSVVQIGRRAGGQSVGGISPQAPRDLRDH